MKDCAVKNLDEVGLFQAPPPGLAGVDLLAVSKEVEDAAYALAGEIPSPFVASILRVAAELERLDEVLRIFKSS